MSREIYELLRTHPRSDHRWVGLEVERLLSRGRRTVHYEDGVEAIFNELVLKRQWRSSYEFEGRRLALERNLHSISVEPGGQFEISPAPRESVQAIESLLLELDAEWKALEAGRTLEVLPLGLNPFEEADSIGILPSPRYRLMDAHFRGLRSLKRHRGPEMMRLSAGLQVNLDFASDEEGLEMLRVGFLIAPALSAVFSNSPYYLGSRSEALSERHQVWRETDPARSGFIDRIFQENFNLEAYCDYVGKVPLMYAYDEAGEVIDPRGKAFHDLSSPLKKKNALAALRQLFTEVRIKPCCVELRFFDAQEEKFRYAATAAVVGLVYDEQNRKEILAELKPEHLAARMDLGSRLGLREDAIYYEVRKFLLMADKGLKRRGLGEEKYLEPIERLIAKRQTPAEIFIAESAEAWGLRP